MPIRVLQLSDIHFGAEDRDAVDAASGFIRDTSFDLLLITGDITQLGRPEEFEAARTWLAGLPGPKLITPGNHDTPWWGLLERVTAPFERYERAIGPAAEGFYAGPGFVAACFNSARGWQVRLNWSKGEVGEGQVNSALKRLRTADAGSIRMAICHHPLVEIPGEPITARVRGGRRAAGRLAAGGVDLIVTGHLHTPFVTALPIHDGMTYAVGASTLSLRERGAPPGFNIIELDAGAVNVTAMAWSGKHLSADRTWIVPLRARANSSPSILRSEAYRVDNS